MRRAIFLILALTLIPGAVGCLRLSDPIYVFKPLRAHEPPGPAYSLLLVSVDFAEVSLTGIHTIYFARWIRTPAPAMRM